MYSLGFIDEIESVKERTLQIQELYILAGQKMSNMQKNMKKMIEELEAIEDRKSKEFKDKIQECKDAEKEYETILNEYEQWGEKLEVVKEYAKMRLESNKDILEKYKDSENDSDIEKSEKLKYVQLLGDMTAKQRIAQCNEALIWLEEDYKNEKFSEMYTKFEKMLGIKRQIPQVIFNAKKHIYSYTDELGNEVTYDFFDKDEDGTLKSKLTDENIQTTIDFAKARGLTNRQIKKIDIYVAMTLINSNSNMFDNYIDSIKSGIKPKFGIYYDLRTFDIQQEEMLIKKEFNMIKRSAIAQKKIGIATVLMNKSKFKMLAILKALGIGATSYTAIGDGNNE